MSVQESVFEYKLTRKKETVIPVHNTNDESDPGNWRPVPLLSIFIRKYHPSKCFVNKNVLFLFLFCFVLFFFLIFKLQRSFPEKYPAQ